jgi:hypothetical protein
MPINTPPVVVNVFDTREEAAGAVAALHAAGFGETDVGVGARPAATDADGVTGPPTWEYGAGAGGILGASMGGLVAGPPGMAGGALVGLLLGTLLDLGVNEEDARRYTAEAEAGRAVVTVRAGGRIAEAREILRRHGGSEAGV